MTSEPPSPKTHFAIMPAKPKGTIEDYKAGNLPPAAPAKDTPVPTGKKGAALRRRPNPPKFAEQSTAELQRAVRVAEEIEATPQGQPTPYERVRDDLLFKRRQIDAALRALEELYE